ncbi:MAG: rod shape-determining protein RodA [Patescibacteria group bacterium]
MQKLKIDWYICIPAMLLAAFALFTLASFGEVQTRFIKQFVWVLIGIGVFFFVHKLDLSYLQERKVTLAIYGAAILALLLLFVSGHVAKGAQSWIRLGFLSIQPTDPAKIALILLLAKYFSKRHIEISAFRHIFASGMYAGALCILVLLQPDFGSAVTVFAIWAGMVFVSGISKKHIIILAVAVILSVVGAWNFAFKEYQKQRIINFIHPLADIRGSGYNQYQAVIAVGSGQLWGKGVGYGTQSKLKFLPEYQTDFIFAAFAEEWGFVGVTVLLLLCATILLRMLYIARHASTNFDVLFITGVVVFFGVHMCINIGMNIGVMPVTGIPLPFMSYGGSHIMMEFLALGIVSSMAGSRRGIERRRAHNEFVGF